MIKLILTLFVALSLQAKVYDGVAVVVANEAITLLDIKKEMQKDNIDAKKATDLLIRQKLEAQEIQKRGISVSSSEVYDDIKKLAQRNGMDVSQFYDAVRESNGISSEELKRKIRRKLLVQKLYNAIAMGDIQQPSDSELQDYYELHKKEFLHPNDFSVIIYTAQDRALLEEKVHNPMFYSPQITQHEQVLTYGRISPQLASLLSKTPAEHFTPVVPDGKGGFMSFYVKSVDNAKGGDFKAVRMQVLNALMQTKREAVLSDYFARLRDNADIKIIRMPK